MRALRLLGRPRACAAAPGALRGHARTVLTSAQQGPAAESGSPSAYVFSAENFRAPKLPSGLAVRDVPLEQATEASLQGLGFLVSDPEEFSVARRTFEIKQWPQPGWRRLDPGTGDEAGTTEGDFQVQWRGDFYHAENLAVATENNKYVEGLGALPELASAEGSSAALDSIYLWMSDYHPDGGQLFWPRSPMSFAVCLGPASKGDDVRPEDMRAFVVPEGRGLYIHPGTWHNGVYVSPRHADAAAGQPPARFFTRQGRVHARVSCSWAAEFGTLLRVPLP